MQAILLCGGKGERLRPLTESVPKPLVPIKGRPIVDYIVNHLQKFNITELIVTAGYKSEKMYEHFANNPSITVLDSGDVDIIKRIKEAAHLIKGDFLLFYGDTLSDVDINSLIDFHKKNDHLVTVTAWPFKSQFGLMEIADDGSVLEFKEKPVLDKWINIGHFYFKYQALNLLSQFDSFEGFLKYLVNGKLLNAYKHHGVHITVNTVKELSEAEESIDSINLAHEGVWKEVIGLEKEYSSRA